MIFWARNPSGLTVVDRSLEAPLESQNGYLTPNERFFVCNSGTTPIIDANEHVIRVHGDGVANELELSIADLEAMPQRVVPALLECAGNHRFLFQEVMGDSLDKRPQVTELMWGPGAVGMAQWRGVQLRHVLEAAGLAHDAFHVCPKGSETDSREGEVKIPMPVSKAMDADTILALAMNGQPLPPDHGFPVRVIVPGWIGAYSVKWVREIEVSSQPMRVTRNTEFYVLKGGDGPAEGVPISALNLKSSLALSWPATLPAGIHLLNGYARSSGVPIDSVHWSEDQGRRWHPANLTGPNERYCWARFEFQWSVIPGRHVLMTRATDRHGRTQPATIPFNFGRISVQCCPPTHCQGRIAPFVDKERRSIMKITRTSVFQVDVPIKPATISHDRVMTVFDETLVRIETDAGIEGWGDSVPWGSNFVAAFARGVRAGLDELAPHLIGRDPRMVGAINELMDFEMTGQPSVKTALDVACWDILGRSLNTPLYMLLGGMMTPRPKVVGSIPPEPGEALEAAIAALRANGIAQFSGKTSGDVAQDIAYLRWMGERLRPGESLKYDGNGGWRVDEAVRVARAMGDIDVYFEQPCATYEECRDVRRSTGVPLILDESATDVGVVIRAKQDGVLDGLNLKLAKVGGISKMRLVRDLCVALRVPMEIQDSSYSEIACAVVAHMGHSTPQRCIRSVIYPKGLQKITVTNAPTITEGRMIAPDEPGIGAVPVPDMIGEPIAVYE